MPCFLASQLSSCTKQRQSSAARNALETSSIGCYMTKPLPSQRGSCRRRCEFQQIKNVVAFVEQAAHMQHATQGRTRNDQSCRRCLGQTMHPSFFPLLLLRRSLSSSRAEWQTPSPRRQMQQQHHHHHRLHPAAEGAPDHHRSPRPCH
jgi:hypothetical protein